VEIIRDFSTNKFHCSIIYSAAITMISNLALIPSLHKALLTQASAILHCSLYALLIYDEIGINGSATKDLSAI
jgi:hypothetical protein